MTTERPLIICTSTQYWGEAWFRKQHFMSRLSVKRPVLYVEPSHSIARRARAVLAPEMRNPLVQPRVRRRGETLWTLTPPRGLPFWTHASVSRIQYRLWGGMLRREAQRLGFSRTWLWLYNPLYVQSCSSLRPERLIFDMVDELGAYDAGVHSRRTMGKCVESALESADLVFTTSGILAETYSPRTRTGKLHMVPNGVRGDWVDRPPRAVPERIRDLPRPRIGFLGALFSYLDYDLLAETARAFPEGTLVLVGPVTDYAGVARVAGESNVVLIGSQPQEKVPDFVSAFDVCLCPFRSGPIRRAVNPLKIYEYLALGRPVVSTPLESLMSDPIAPQIRFAEGAPAFVEAVRAALDCDTPEEQRARREAVRPYTWEVLGERVEGVLETAEREWVE